MKKYYAVIIGKTPGIYTDWNTTESMIKNYPGAMYRSFLSKAEAETFYNQSTKKETVLTYYNKPIPNKTVIYTDGSSSGQDCGYGIIIITSSGDKLTVYGRVPLPYTNNIAELYAIYVALSLVNGNIILYSNSRQSISCTTSYIQNCMRNGWSNLSNKQLLEAIYSKTLGRDVAMHYIPHHAGISVSTEANQLAKKGRENIEPCVIYINGLPQFRSHPQQ